MADADSPSRSNRMKSAPSHLSDFTCSETTGSNDTSPSEPKPKRARPDTSGDAALARRLAREGARPRKLQEADATADRALKALEALPGSRYDAAATAAAALAGADLGLTRNERLAVLNVAPTNAAVVGAVVDNDTREPRLDDAQVAKVCAVAKELRA